MIEKIKKLYKQIAAQNKEKFIGMVAKEFNMQPTSVYNHWFSRFWAIPEDKQARVLELLQNWIKQQNKVSA